MMVQNCEMLLRAAFERRGMVYHLLSCACVRELVLLESCFAHAIRRDRTFQQQRSTLEKKGFYLVPPVASSDLR